MTIFMAEILESRIANVNGKPARPTTPLSKTRHAMSGATTLRNGHQAADRGA
jgi:hypothetical protein